MPTPERTRVELQVCVDCLAIDANGADSIDDGEAVARFERAMETATRSGYVYANACPEECEGSFSWRPCDFCGSTLGGDRHPAVLIPKGA